MQYRNTPLSSVGKSPAQLLFGRILRDHLPNLPAHYRAHPEWLMSPQERFQATAKRDAATVKRYNASAKSPPPLAIGTRVYVQNQGTNRPLLWEQQGTVMQVLPFKQYRVLLDDTQNITTRKRRFTKPLWSKK